MMHKLTIFLLICFMVVTECTGEVMTKKSEKEDQQNIEEKIDRIFMGFLNEEFFEQEGVTPDSGWVMLLPSGREVTRSFLMNQASPVIVYGDEAVPHLFKWVMNENLAVRYIAIYSLQQITGLSPYTPYFDKEDRTGNRQKAIKIWKEWWEKQQEKQ